MVSRLIVVGFFVLLIIAAYLVIVSPSTSTTTSGKGGLSSLVAEKDAIDSANEANKKIADEMKQNEQNFNKFLEKGLDNLDDGNLEAFVNYVAQVKNKKIDISHITEDDRVLQRLNTLKSVNKQLTGGKPPKIECGKTNYPDGALDSVHLKISGDDMTRSVIFVFNANKMNRSTIYPSDSFKSRVNPVPYNPTDKDSSKRIDDNQCSKALNYLKDLIREVQNQLPGFKWPPSGAIGG